MGENRKKDWRELCKAAAIELDPVKLMNLIAELTSALDERDEGRGEVARQNLKDGNLNKGSLPSEPAVA